MKDNKFLNEMQIIEQNQKEINIKITNNNNTFEKYYILNKDWYNSYKISFTNQNNYELFSSVKKLCPEINTKTISLKIDTKSYYFPSNFVIVNQNVINQISKNFGETDKKEIQNLSYNVLIFEGCVMIKSNLNPKVLNVSVLSENNDTKYENEIRYIFDFIHTEWMNEEIKFMQKKGFKEYLHFKNIHEKNSVDFREIKDEQKNIGIIVYIRNKPHKESNLNNQAITSNSNKITTKIDSIFKSLLLGLNHFDLFTKKLKDIAKSNPNYLLSQKLSKAFVNLSSSQTINTEIEYEFNSSIKTGKYGTIFTDLFSKLDKELNKNNINKNAINQNNEAMVRQNFKNAHSNPSIIENLFYLVMQNKIFCDKCNSINYIFEYSQYISIELEGNNKIKMSDKIFEIKNKNCICQKCKNDKCIKEIKIDELPYILIVIIKGKESEKFNISDNFKITIKNMPGFLYSLNCFIEKGTNNFCYQKGYNWFKIDINNNSIKEINNCIYDMNPSVLFYKSVVNGQRGSINNFNAQINQMNNNNISASNNSNGNNNFFINNNWNMNNQNNINNQMRMNNSNNMNIQMNFNNNQMNRINNSNNMNMNIQMNNKNQMNNNNQMNMNMNMNMNNMQNQMNMANNNNNFNMMNMNNMNNMFNQININGINNQMGMNYPMNMNNQMNNQMNMNKFNTPINNMKVNTNMVLNNINKNNNNNFQDEDENTIFVTFTFDINKKQIYLDVNENRTFENVISLLQDKYNWFGMIKNKKYFFNNQEITNYKLSLKNLGIKESSDIIIK